MAPGQAWRVSLQRFFLVIAVGNLVWESAQVPLYTLWKTDTASKIIYAVLHCTVGDVLIAGASLIGSLLLLGTAKWPLAHFLRVAAATVTSGFVITTYIEHLSIARGTWAYSGRMPLLPGTSIGLSPLAQWIVIPVLAFAVARPVKPSPALDLPTMGIPTSGVTPNHLARSDRKPS